MDAKKKNTFKSVSIHFATHCQYWVKRLTFEDWQTIFGRRGLNKEKIFASINTKTKKITAEVFCAIKKRTLYCEKWKQGGSICNEIGHCMFIVSWFTLYKTFPSYKTKCKNGCKCSKLHTQIWWAAKWTRSLSLPVRYKPR